MSSFTPLSTKGTFCAGLELSNDIFDPSRALVNTKYGRRFYKAYPVIARSIAVPINATLGFIKPFIVPIIALVASVTLPIFGTIKLVFKDKQRAKEIFSAWGFTLLAGLGTITFLAVSAFYLTLLQGTTLVILACSISIIIHVYRVSKEPSEPPSLSLPVDKEPVGNSVFVSSRSQSPEPDESLFPS